MLRCGEEDVVRGDLFLFRYPSFDVFGDFFADFFCLDVGYLGAEACRVAGCVDFSFIKSFQVPFSFDDVLFHGFTPG